MSTNEQLMEQCRKEAELHRLQVVRQRLGRELDEFEVRYTGDAWREYCEGYAAALYAERSKPRTGVTVDELAQQIRIVDGGNTLGAGALAEALMPFLTSKLNNHGPTL